MNRAVRYERVSLAVSREDVMAATALLETATGRLAAISHDKRTRVISVWLPAGESKRGRAQAKRMVAAAQRARALGSVSLATTQVSDDAWASSWKRFYKPFCIAPRLWIAPTWARSFRPPRGASVLRLDPGMAFGTGLHPTTRLALELLLAHIASEDVVLDIGCGSGILGLAAALRGANVYACDSDAVAVRAARSNFAANALRPRRIIHAKDAPLAFPQAQVIVANITARVLTRLAPLLARKLVQGGWLITSGVVESGKGAVLKAFERVGLRCDAVMSHQEWFAFAHRKVKR